jgi:hypothetical protein
MHAAPDVIGLAIDGPYDGPSGAERPAAPDESQIMPSRETKPG